jgi:predicted neuraminidase
MEKKMTRLLSIVLLVAMQGAAVLLAQSGLEPGELAGPVLLTSPEGLPVTMNNFTERRGTAVLFLSSRDEGTDTAAENIVALDDRLSDHRILVIAVFEGTGITGAEIRRYCQFHGFNFPVYVDPGGRVAAKFGARVTPSGYLLDHDGKLIYFGPMGSFLAAVAAFDEGASLPASSALVGGTSVDKALPPSTLTDPYGSIRFSSELIFSKIDGYPAHHCSSMTLAPNGDLLVSWYGGSYESSDDQVLFLARLKKGTHIWTNPEILVRSPGKPPGNAVLFTTADNKIWLVWGRMEGTQPMLRGTGWDACSLFFRTSTDGGVTWTEDKPFYHDTLGWLPRNLTIKLADGTLVLPLSDERNGHGVDLSFFLATKDNGATWTRSAIMRGGEQPTIIQRTDGTLLAYLRVRPNIVAAESHDSGKSWTVPAPTQWKNPDAGISMTRLRNGHLLLVFNDEDDSRSPLHIARSTDEGRTWSKPLIIETNPGEYSYPSIFESPDGTIHLIYTFRRFSIKHVEMNEEWFTQLERPD